MYFTHTYIGTCTENVFICFFYLVVLEVFESKVNTLKKIERKLTFKLKYLQYYKTKKNKLNQFLIEQTDLNKKIYPLTTITPMVYLIFWSEDAIS